MTTDLPSPLVLSEPASTEDLPGSLLYPTPPTEPDPLMALSSPSPLIFLQILDHFYYLIPVRIPLRKSDSTQPYSTKHPLPADAENDGVISFSLTLSVEL